MRTPLLLLAILLPLTTFAQDSLNVSKLGSLSFWGQANSVTVTGQYAFVATSNSGMRIVDISNSTTPLEVGYYDTPGSAMDIAVQGEYAYVADAFQGFRVINIINPTAPVETGFSVEGLSNTFAIAVQGQYACVTAQYGMHHWLKVFDISDPEAPVPAGSVVVGDGYDIEIHGDYAFVAGSGVRIVDFSDPADPQLVGSCDSPGYGFGITVADGYAYMADGLHGLCVFDIHDPASPVLLSSCETPGNAKSIKLYGNYAVMCDQSGGVVSLVDVSDPDQPVYVSDYILPGSAYDIFITGDLAYIANGMNGFSIVDLSTPQSPTEIGSRHLLSGTVVDVALADNYAFLADRTHSGLLILDISEPAAPIPTGYCGMAGNGFASGVAVQNGYAYVIANSGEGNEPGKLCVFNVSDPHQPTLTGIGEQTIYGFDIAIQGDYIYVAESDLKIYCISAPAMPVLTADYQTSRITTGVDVSGDYVYISDGLDGLRIIDAGDPSAPEEIGFCEWPGEAVSVTVEGGYAYVTVDNYGLYIVDISDPFAPVELGHCDTPDQMYAVRVQDGYAYVACKSSGVRIINVQNPSSPLEVGYYDTPGSSQGIAYQDGITWVADTYYFHVLDGSAALGVQEPRLTDGPPASYSLLPVYPNPFNASAVITLDLPVAAEARVSVFSLTGQLVAELTDGILSTGSHRFTFDAANHASGVYFINATIPGHLNETRKVTLIR